MEIVKGICLGIIAFVLILKPLYASAWKEEIEERIHNLVDYLEQVLNPNATPLHEDNLAARMRKMSVELRELKENVEKCRKDVDYLLKYRAALTENKLASALKEGMLPTCMKALREYGENLGVSVTFSEQYDKGAVRISLEKGDLQYRFDWQAAEFFSDAGRSQIASTIKWLADMKGPDGKND